MLVTGRIAAFAQFDPSYSSGSTNMHLHLIHGSLSPYESAPQRHLDRFNHLVGIAVVTNREATEKDHVTPRHL